MSIDFSYFSTTRPDSLAGGLDNTTTSVVLADGSSYPDPALFSGQPYTVILAYGSEREEVCTVIAKPTATTLTVIRGEDGTPPTAKNAGDVVVHGVSAREFRTLAEKLDRSGGQMTGSLVLYGDPVARGEAGSKGYIDDMDDAISTDARAYTDTVAANTALTAKNYTDAEIAALTPVLNAKASTVSPTFTGNPTAPTAPNIDNDTTLATTAFVQTVGDIIAQSKIVNNSTGTETDKAMSVAAAKVYSDAQVVNALGTGTGVAPSQAAVNAGLAGKANIFRTGRTALFAIGASNSTGDINITHGLGRTPTAVFVSVDDDGGDCSVFGSVQSFTSTTIVAQMRNIGGAETGCRLNWMAI